MTDVKGMILNYCSLCMSVCLSVCMSVSMSMIASKREVSTQIVISESEMCVFDPFKNVTNYLGICMYTQYSDYQGTRLSTG